MKLDYIEGIERTSKYVEIHLVGNNRNINSIINLSYMDSPEGQKEEAILEELDEVIDILVSLRADTQKRDWLISGYKGK